jgi:signal transduction histidine kinase
MREAQLAERRRMSEVRAELLRHTVTAQESERQRIARELHDQTGQHLTALAMGLRGLAQNIETNPQRAIQQANQLEKVAGEGLQELQHIVTRLRPPQLDELGLLAALRWIASSFSDQYHLPIEVTFVGNGLELSDDARIVFFRIAQEALLNVVRHANASQVKIHLENTTNRVTLSIEDDGEGFDTDIALQTDQKYPSWGLLGMIERSVLVGADLDILSEPGEGTKITISLERE